MNTYRSLNTIQAVQYTGDPLPGITCEGGNESLDPIARHAAVMAAGCDSSRKHLPHVHANVTGGMVVLQPGDWIFPVQGGPWGVASDAKFRSYWEVPAPVIPVPTPHTDLTAPDVAQGEGLVAQPPATFPDTPVPVAVVPEPVVPHIAETEGIHDNVQPSIFTD